MLLGSSISNTKKFLQRTLENFKTCFSPGYQKLPKTNQFSYSVAAASVLDMDNNYNNPCYKDLEKFYSDFTQKWDSEKEKGRRIRRSKKKEQEVHNESFVRSNPASHEEKKEEECDKKKNKKGLNHQRVVKKQEKDSSLNIMVEKKLREMEMLDMRDVDYVLDIEEVLHYYSRLTSPVYLEIVDKFFMEIYSEFFGGAPVTTPPTPTINSRLK